MSQSNGVLLRSLMLTGEPQASSNELLYQDLNTQEELGHLQNEGLHCPLAVGWAAAVSGRWMMGKESNFEKKED